MTQSVLAVTQSSSLWNSYLCPLISKTVLDCLIISFWRPWFTGDQGILIPVANTFLQVHYYTGDMHVTTSCCLTQIWLHTFCKWLRAMCWTAHTQLSIFLRAIHWIELIFVRHVLKLDCWISQISRNTSQLRKEWANMVIARWMHFQSWKTFQFIVSAYLQTLQCCILLLAKLLLGVRAGAVSGNPLLSRNLIPYLNPS